ncbi:MAG: hypothetical protein AB7F31_06880 [Parachlamydiales bacterium]
MSQVSSVTLYVNGVGNWEREALVVTSLLESSTGVETFLNYNPHTLLSGVFTANRNDKDPPVLELRQTVRHYLSKDVPVLIIAHSHGAQVTQRALQALRDGPERSKLRKLVSVIAFGGITVIDNSLAQSILNVVNVYDNAAYTGSVVSKTLTDLSEWFNTSERPIELKKWYEVVTDNHVVRTALRSQYNAKVVSPTGKANEWSSNDGRHHTFALSYLPLAIEEILKHRKQLAQETGQQFELLKGSLFLLQRRYQLFPYASTQEVEKLRSLQEITQFLKGHLQAVDFLKKEEREPLILGVTQANGDIIQVHKTLNQYLPIKEARMTRLQQSIRGALHGLAFANQWLRVEPLAFEPIANDQLPQASLHSETENPYTFQPPPPPTQVVQDIPPQPSPPDRPLGHLQFTQKEDPVKSGLLNLIALAIGGFWLWSALKSEE